MPTLLPSSATRLVLHALQETEAALDLEGLSRATGQRVLSLVAALEVLEKKGQVRVEHSEGAARWALASPRAVDRRYLSCEGPALHQARDMQTIDADRTKEILERDEGVVIDVLPEESYQKQHIPGAVNIPVGKEDFLERVENIVPSKQTPVVVYCADKECQASPTAAEKLGQAGFEEVLEFEGGLKEWRRARFDLEGEGKTSIQAREA